MEYATKNLSQVGYQDYCLTKEGKVYSLKSKRFLTTQYNDGGYEVITLRKNGKTCSLKIHRLLCLMYKSDSYFEGAMVNHIDGNKKNNSLNNLEWVTRSENVLHAYSLGLIKNKPRQISEDDIHIICQRLEDGARVIDVSKEFNVDRTIIYSIFNGEAYKHVSFEYDFSRVPKLEKISTDNVIVVCKMLSSGATTSEISDKSGIHLSTVKAIKQRRVHKTISDSFVW